MGLGFLGFQGLGFRAHQLFRICDLDKDWEYSHKGAG